MPYGQYVGPTALRRTCRSLISHTLLAGDTTATGGAGGVVVVGGVVVGGVVVVVVVVDVVVPASVVVVSAVAPEAPDALVVVAGGVGVPVAPSARATGADTTSAVTTARAVVAPAIRVLPRSSCLMVSPVSCPAASRWLDRRERALHCGSAHRSRHGQPPCLTRRAGRRLSRLRGRLWRSRFQRVGRRRTVSTCSARPTGPAASCRVVAVRPRPVVPMLTRVSNPTHPRTGSRKRWIVRSTLGNIHLRGDTRTAMPLAVSTRRMRSVVGEQGSPSTSAWSVRIHVRVRPGRRAGSVRNSRPRM